jgi:outer membrane protein assembly factor BamE (lipoprotein component of BamABCDE complex)
MVGRERRERISLTSLARRRECFDSRRRVNSIVGHLPDMKLSRFIAVVVLQVAIVGSTSAVQRTTLSGGRVRLSVAAVRLGSSSSLVRKHLGRPTAVVTRRDDSMGSVETVRTIKYPGLTVTLHKMRRVFRVVSVEVTSSDWLVAPGVRVGFDAKQVAMKLGTPYEESSEGDRHRYQYLNAGGDGWALLDFENNKLVAVRWSYDLT